MRGTLGIDTSNYTTSAALYRGGEVTQQKRLLPVAPGQIGLRQSDAVFCHIKALGELVERLMEQTAPDLAAIGASGSPRGVEGSYMPCFLAGRMAAQVTAAAMRLPLHVFSHQAGHLAAALYGAGRLELLDRPFLAFHVSGGTTECLLVEDVMTERIRLLSATNDLNAGQLVDRVGGMLGLEFPAGPALDALASASGARCRVKPSFQGRNPCLSGVENQCRAALDRGEAGEDIARFCLSHIFVALRRMAREAVEETGCDTLLFAGGVMSNSILRAELEAEFGGIFAPAEYSRDNAAGIAVLAAVASGLGPAVKKEDPTCP